MIAQKISNILDESADLRRKLKQIEKESTAKGMKVVQHAALNEVYQRSLLRDEQAAQCLQSHKAVLEKIGTQEPKSLQMINTYAARHARYRALNQLAIQPKTHVLSEQLIKDIVAVDVVKDYYQIANATSKNNQSPDLLIKQVKQLKEVHAKQVWDALKKDHPILVEYKKLNTKYAKSSGYAKEQVYKSLQSVVTIIKGNKDLMHIVGDKTLKVTLKLQNLHVGERSR